MLSIRALTRSIPRCASKINLTAIRRPLTTVRQPTLLQSSWVRASSSPRAAALFSTSSARAEKQGQVDEELAAKLESEVQLEKEMRDSDDLPVNVRDYLDNAPFSIEDTPGQEEVVLTRQFGDESIRITFTTADLNDMDPDADSDRALFDEDDEDDEEVEGDTSGPLATSAQSGGAQSKSTVKAGRTDGGNVAVAPEDQVSAADRSSASAGADQEAEEDEDEDDDDDAEPSFPARLIINVSKPSTGTLQLDTVAQDGVVVIQNVGYHPPGSPSSKPANATAESEFATRNAYLGPPFGNLDEDLQVLLERYLDERGINTELALFVPDYIDYKEQREYIDWLQSKRQDLFFCSYVLCSI
ncbi:MAG: hypothetical protein M1825_004216 [Sarcosagium campestre]|nr:MAG: hypothetical protein M1825_004216 [Sarcosagium campestre]